MLDIKFCPTCGSDRLKRVTRTVRREFEGKAYSVPGVAFFECPVCGEQLFPQEAVDKIQSHSPAFKGRQRASA